MALMIAICHIGVLTFVQRLDTAEISTLWPFRYPLLVKPPIKIASSPELSEIGMTSLISSAPLSDHCVSKFTSLVRARD